jgi:hypothetical protein
MKTSYLPQPILMEKAIKALIEKLGISKASEFWTSLGYGKKDYLQLRKKLFKKETVESLYRKIKKEMSRDPIP